MTCLCGKNMCYICRKPVESDHSHFYHERVEKDKWVICGLQYKNELLIYLTCWTVSRCPLHTDENIVHTKAVEVAARIILKELKEKKPELLKKIDINKLLPTVEQSNESQMGNLSNVGNVNQLLATIIGQKVEDINNLEDISMFNCFFYSLLYYQDKINILEFWHLITIVCNVYSVYSWYCKLLSAFNLCILEIYYS